MAASGELFRKARDAALRRLGPRAPAVLEAEEGLARVLVVTGEHGRALYWLTSAAKRSRVAGDRLRTLGLRRMRAVALRDMGRAGPARDEFRRVIRLLDPEDEDDADLFDKSLAGLARTLETLGPQSAAARAWSRVHAHRVQRLGERAPETRDALARLKKLEPAARN
jgi:hypothetical protein